MPPISDLISPLKSALPAPLFENAQRYLSQLDAKLLDQIKMLTMDNAMLHKQVNQWKSEYGDLYFSHQAATTQINELRAVLRAAREKEMEEMREELRRLRAELARREHDNEKLQGRYDKLQEEHGRLEKIHEVAMNTAGRIYRDFRKRLAELETNVPLLLEAFNSISGAKGNPETGLRPTVIELD